MKKSSIILFLALARILCAADTAYSPPVGGMTIVVPSGQTRAVSVPLVHDTVASGAVIGRITGVGSNYIEDSAANWVPGELSAAANPYYLRIKTGAAAGRVLMVSTSANTTTRVNLTNDGTDLTQLGIAVGAAGDVYELVMADTLADLFGASLQAGPDATTADTVQVWSGTAWVTYYQNTARSRWERSTDTAASPDRSNLLLRPDRGVMLTRRAATELKMYVTGSVPRESAKYIHARPGTTFLSLAFPKDTTLGALNLNTALAGWRVSNVAASAAGTDQVQVWSNTAWVNYYYDATKDSWQRTTDVLASPNRSSLVISAGRPIMIVRQDVGPATTVAWLMNYTIAR